MATLPHMIMISLSQVVVCSSSP